MAYPYKMNMQSDPSLVEVKIGALIMDPNTNTPIVVLKGVDSEAVLPIWVGAFEANAIALEIEKVAPQRPMTHDLLRNVIIECGLLASSVVVTDLAENTFYARIELLDKKGDAVFFDARPSDAIALATAVALRAELRGTEVPLAERRTESFRSFEHI